MSKDTIAMRIILGIGLLGIGAMTLMSVLMPTETAADTGSKAISQRFLEMLYEVGYVMLVVAIVEVAVGLSLIFNRFVALSLVIVSPILINMVLYHAFLDIKGIVPALILIVLNCYLMIKYKKNYAPILQVGTKRQGSSV